MATLRYTQIRGHTGAGGCIHYIANKDKMISGATHDIYNVLNYMGEPDSVERVYSFGHHCSQNPDLAEKEIALHRERYFASKKGGIQGLKAGSEELLGLHFFISYTVADSPSEYIMNKIAMRIAMHPLLKDFAVFGANHFDQEHRHTHFFVSAYSAEGKPRKLCLRKDDYNEIRRFANQLCVEYGLSIIDLSALRWKNPEYSAWIDSVIASGKVTVHPEKEEHKKRPKQKIPTRNLYYKWQKQGEERAEERYKLMTDIQRQKKNFEDKYYYTTDGDKNKRWYVSGDPQHRFYTISLNSGGYQRSEFELAVRFVLSVAANEGKYIKRNAPSLWLKYNAKVDWELQGMVDSLGTAREMNIESTKDVPVRIADVGKQMNALRQEKKRHENSIAKHEQIIRAYQTYTRVRPTVEGVQEPEPDMLAEYKAAYTILAQNQTLSHGAYEDICRRRDFERQKEVDYEKRMRELSRQYRDLKKLEAVAENPTGYLKTIYSYSKAAEKTRENEREL